MDPAVSPESGPVDLVLPARVRDLGGFSVRRALPAVMRRALGPFVFFDHMGPHVFAPGDGMDVRPHPHVALATVTYLLEGEIMHRDSLGTAMVIRAGDVNWMTAGRGIAHSERTPADRRATGGGVHGIQSWVALPRAHEETEPAFQHCDGATLPLLERPGVALRVLAGTAYGLESPVRVLMPTLYVHARLEAGAELAVDATHTERGVYVMTGRVELGGAAHGEATMLVLRPGDVTLRAVDASDVLLVGGAPLDGPRHIWWNFVASTEERIERAKADWRERRFPPIPGDDVEFIPLPEG